MNTDFLRIFFRRLDDDLHAASRGQATDHLRAIDLGQLAAGGVPELYPEGPRGAVNRESRAVGHHRHRLGNSSRTQRLEQLRNVRLEFLELDQHGAVVDPGRWQLNRIFRLQQKPRLSLLIPFLNDRHKLKSFPAAPPDTASNVSANAPQDR